MYNTIYIITYLFDFLLPRFQLYRTKT